MKNVIKYFYNIDLDNIRMIDDNYYFVYKNRKFVFYQIKDMQFNQNLINKLNSLLSKKVKEFFRIIQNKDNNIITIYENKKYILMLENFSNDREFDYTDVLKTNIDINNLESYNNSNNWDKLWKIKVDYFEMFIENNMNKYPQLNIYYNYFIGMAENAISYYKDVIEKKEINFYDKPVISHKRIENDYTFKDLYNPMSLMIDHPSRDLAEYLKKLFWNKKNDYNTIVECLNKAKLSSLGSGILFSRMIYPSFFFDEFEKLVNNQIKVNDMIKIINRMEEYEQFLLKLYIILNKKYNISQIEWIKKIDYSSTLTTPKTSGTSLINIDSIPSLSVTSIMLQ